MSQHASNFKRQAGQYGISSAEGSYFDFTLRVDGWDLRRHVDFVNLSLFCTHALFL